MNRHESMDAVRELDAGRIHETCEAHLVRVFEIAPTLRTWYTQHSVGGTSESSFAEDPSEENPLSDVVERSFPLLEAVPLSRDVERGMRISAGTECIRHHRIGSPTVVFAQHSAHG